MAFNWLRKHKEAVLFVFLIVCTALTHVHWLRVDTLLGPGIDEKSYFIHLAQFLATVRSDHAVTGEAIQELSFEGRPPLYQLLSLPFLRLLKMDMDAGIMLNLLFHAALLLAVYKSGELIADKRTGLLAAFLVSVYPPLVQLARVYRPNLAVAACAASLLWSLLLIVKRRSVRYVWLAALITTIGLYLHPLFVFSAWFPLLAAGMYSVFFQTEPRLPQKAARFPAWVVQKLRSPIFLRGFLPAFGLAGVVVAGWYFSKPAAQLLYELQKISGEANSLNAYRGYEAFFFGPSLKKAPSFAWYLYSMPWALSWIFALFAIAGILYAVSLRNHTRWPFFLVGSYAGAYLAFSNITTFTWRHFGQILPALALLSTWWLSEIKNPRLRQSLIALLVGNGLFVYLFVNGALQVPAPLARLWGAPYNAAGVCVSGKNELFCPNPPLQEDWRIEEIVEKISADPACRPQECGVLVLSSQSAFTYAAFNYHVAKDLFHFPAVFLDVGGVTYHVQPFPFDLLFHSRFILYVQEESIFLNRRPKTTYLWHALDVVQNPPESFAASYTEMAVFQLPRNKEAHLLKRVRPLTLQEALEVIERVRLDFDYKYSQFRVLAPLFVQEGEYRQALKAYQQALAYEPDEAFLYFGLAGVYEKLGQMEEAAQAYRKVIALGSDPNLVRQAQDWLSAHR